MLQPRDGWQAMSTALLPEAVAEVILRQYEKPAKDRKATGK